MLPKLWLDCFTKPKETFAKQKNKANLGKLLLNIAVSAVGFATLFLFLQVMPFTQPLLSEKELLFGTIMFLPFSWVAFSIIFLINECFFAALHFLFSRLLGGKGTYTQLLWLGSLTSPIGNTLQALPYFGIAVAIYSMYLNALLVKESQGLNFNRAALVILLSLGVYLAFLFLIGQYLEGFLPVLYNELYSG
ncbi:MAG TPA: YIP1 family protein [Candidatus Nanoarchaeia archaeon]|nr:YIP1 family protein [Candidatus Nanoarchaeia archaeon]